MEQYRKDLTEKNLEKTISAMKKEKKNGKRFGFQPNCIVFNENNKEKASK